MVFAVFLSSCATGAQYTLPPDLTLVPGNDVPQQVATLVSDALTQTALPPATSTPIPGVATSPVGNEANTTQIPGVTGSSAQTLYQSPSLGIQFSYPAAWYRRETGGGVTLTSFDPSNPPHKLEWRHETTSMQFGFKAFITPPALEAWIEAARQAAQAEGWSVHEEERLSIANQPAARLRLVSGSGDMLNRVLIHGMNGRYFEVNLEGNYSNNLAKTVFDSIQPFFGGVIKPAEADTPAAGVCGGGSDLLIIILGYQEGDMFPLAGRCIAVDPSQRIKLINQSKGPIAIKMAEYDFTMPVGGEILLDKPVGQYLALGVHYLPVGPALWVKESVVTTVPPPIMEYKNSVVGYKLNLPGEWRIDENGMANGANKDVIFSPPYAEPFVAYLDISLDFRTLDQIINSYAQYNPDAVREDTLFNGYPGIKYNYFYQGSIVRVEYFIPQGNRIFLIATDRPNDGVIQSILMTIRFTGPPSPTTYEATLADNGRTFFMNIGDKLKLNLDLGYAWSVVSISNPVVIAGAQDGYFAFAGGSSTLSTTGSPECLNSTPPCGMPSVMFTITVIVQ